ncbi:Hypothetical protein FKW44_012565 [Caligus rogercresseyi]|uniref:Uncharacterized protein n=1 Tax=Caligus rogercresseyi TaxID=217165 RepID=A0A7T8HKN7_CALRO|nr:Hypothetical protein FKW44_012565 [Caligus rogercresseyi]
MPLTAPIIHCHSQRPLLIATHRAHYSLPLTAPIIHCHSLRPLLTATHRAHYS